MKHVLSRSSASSGAGAAVLARLFYGLTVENPALQNGAWLAALVGLLLALPVLWLMLRQKNRPKSVMLMLLFLLLLDVAAAMECTAYSESCLAFAHVATVILMLPLALVALRCAWLGGEALGASARVLLWTMPALALLVVLPLFPYYHPAWIAPLLGEGPAQALRLGVRAAGWIATLAGAAILLCGEPPRFFRVCATMTTATLAAVMLMLLRLMMAPSPGVSTLSRAVRIDALLTNGRAPLYLQLPMIVVWFMAMLHLLCFECAACAALLACLLPKLPRWAYTAGAVAAAFALAASRVREPAFFAQCRLPLLLLTVLAVHSGKEAAACDG